jgi:hypothetical protein
MLNNKEITMTAKTYNITVKCKTEEDRDIVLATLDEGVANAEVETLLEQGIIFYGQNKKRVHCSNVYFSENDESHWADQKRMVI